MDEQKAAPVTLSWKYWPELLWVVEFSDKTVELLRTIAKDLSANLSRG